MRDKIRDIENDRTLKKNLFKLNLSEANSMNYRVASDTYINISNDKGLRIYNKNDLVLIYYVVAGLLNEFIERPLVTARIICPKRYKESFIRKISVILHNLAVEYNFPLNIEDAYIESTPYYILELTGISISKPCVNFHSDNIYLHLYGELALSGAMIIAEMNKNIFREEIRKNFLDRKSELVLPYIKCDDDAFRLSLGYGGLYNGINRLSKLTNCGVKIEKEKLLFSQETIELCNMLDINPYKLDSSSAFFYASNKEKEDGFIRIGELTKENDKIVYDKDTKSFVDNNIDDEILKFVGGCNV